ncbi:hypothetical protein Tco_0675116 [Tanacetum coccineum]
MKVYSKHIDWGEVKITKDIMEGYVMPKYGNTNWMEDELWSNIIWDDVYNTFYRDKEAKTKVAKESEDMALSIMKDDKGKGKEAEHDHLKGKGKLVADKGEGKEAEHDHLKVNKDDKGKGKLIWKARAIKEKQVDDHDDDLDTIDLENRIKKLEEDFGRLLKAKKANDVKLAKDAKGAKKEELKAKEAKKAKDPTATTCLHFHKIQSSHCLHFHKIQSFYYIHF